jgi:hypothetical protein
MKPTTPEIIDSIIWSLQTYVQPEIQSPFAESVLKTVENLLRHIRLREGRELPLLVTDVRDLEDVLGQLRNGLLGHAALSAALGGELSRVGAALAARTDYPEALPSVPELNERMLQLRSLLDELLKSMSRLREVYAGDSSYEASRQLVRGYIARSLQRDGELITPAFTGGRR